MSGSPRKTCGTPRVRSSGLARRPDGPQAAGLGTEGAPAPSTTTGARSSPGWLAAGLRGTDAAVSCVGPTPSSPSPMAPPASTPRRCAWAGCSACCRRSPRMRPAPSEVAHVRARQLPRGVALRHGELEKSLSIVIVLLLRASMRLESLLPTCSEFSVAISAATGESPSSRGHAPKERRPCRTRVSSRGSTTAATRFGQRCSGP